MKKGPPKRALQRVPMPYLGSAGATAGVAAGAVTAGGVATATLAARGISSDMLTRLSRAGLIVFRQERVEPTAIFRAIDRVGSGSEKFDATLFEAVEGHLDVRKRRQVLTLVTQGESFFEAGSAQQQTRDKLARGAGIDRDFATLNSAIGMQREGE